MISESVKDILNRLPLDEVMENNGYHFYGESRGKDKRYKMYVCPFHGDNDPSFRVDIAPSKGKQYCGTYCFACKGASGDATYGAIQLQQALLKQAGEPHEFLDACKRLARDFHIVLDNQDYNCYWRRSNAGQYVEPQKEIVLNIADRKHKKFVRTVYGKDITSPEQFDLILNTDRLSVDECVDAICELARKHDIRVKLSESNIDKGTFDHQTRATKFKNETEEEFARILNMYNIEWLYEPKTFPVEWDAEGNVTMAISPDFFLPKFNLYLELTTMDQRYVTKKNKKMRLVQELYPGTNIRIVYKKDFNELVDRLKLFGGLNDNTREDN